MKRSVLIVEDSPAMRQLLSLALGRQRADIVEAGDGLSALKELAKRKFDLMLVDLNMPVLDGMKLIRRVRDDPAIAGMKICVVTTEAAEAVEQQARALGADFYLRKPVARKDVERIFAEAFPA